MSIGSIGSAPPPAASRLEVKEGPGRDKVNDHDADDGAAAVQHRGKPEGTGAVVDVTA